MPRKGSSKSVEKLPVKLNEINPITQNQIIAFDDFARKKNLFLHGVAGTGKTFISLYLALKEVYEGKKQKVIIIRSAVQGREQGFLPGTQEEKAAPYEDAYAEIISEICSGASAYSLLKKHGIIEFRTTSFMRGLNFRDAIVVVDECQNMTDHEFNTVMTRLCEGTRIIFCGDYRQSDFQVTKRKEESGIDDMLDIADEMESFTVIDFHIEDIVRSGVVREYILARIKLDLDE